MSDCICSSCKNLKSIIDENKNGEVKDYECQYGFPSPKCEECAEDACSETCGNYVSDEEDNIRLLKCNKCGKELKASFDEGDDGDVYCIDCFLTL
jgi:hypothetical protein